ncbi:diguanylate cyclase [Wenzhouxiangella sp. AB-CW3]|uniref:sensor domain-containing diguanylate cyclase n=1 Tax=Wenzhouxiangella sp. AB-CW3 TaxID=2771012 RepID=UPI00168ACDDB|nr:sensor domain-containing diguanylate cyclase [Wenzhouxiangella sp. AB-CW3]QOC21308.1 diguanylate cyclase [Wenzhouxiangella sp. AB-CW3]
MPADKGSNSQQLEQTIEELRQAERIQKALYRISDLAGAELDTDDILKRLHQIISDLMYAENFYIFLYNNEKDTVRFRYFADSATKPGDLSQDLHLSDPNGEPGDQASTDRITAAEIPLESISRSLTWYVIRYGQPLRGSLEEIERTLPGPLKTLGAESRDWLGVPMLDGTEVKGMLVLQSYEQENLYSAEDQNLLSFVASHVLTMLQRRQTRRDLEREVVARTRELAEANQALKEEVDQRRRNEHLQKALYHIAEQAGETGGEQDFFELVHREISELIYAENFFIALLVDNDTALEFGYYADKYLKSQKKRSLGAGLTEYALNSDSGVLLLQDEIRELVDTGKIEIHGPYAHAWIGVPLQCEGRTLGLLAVQSYREDRIYRTEDLELLRFVSSQIASSLERKRALASLKEAKETLEERVAERTKELSRANEALAEQSLTDPLTGLRNRRYLIEQAPTDIALVERQYRDAKLNDSDRVAENTDLLFLMIDIDHFKQVNDIHGHAAGDRVLQQMSQILNHCIRKSDTAVRWGGEEFLIVARFTDADFAPTMAERLRKTMAEHDFDLGQGERTHLTCSIGFAQYPMFPANPDRIHWEEVINVADRCLYAAKQSWRDAWVGVCWNEPSSPEPLPKRISPAIPDLIESGRLKLCTSRPDHVGLVWP